MEVTQIGAGRSGLLQLILSSLTLVLGLRVVMGALIPSMAMLTAVLSFLGAKWEVSLALVA